MKPTLLVGILSCVALVQSAAYAEGVILTTTIVSVDVSPTFAIPSAKVGLEVMQSSSLSSRQPSETRVQAAQTHLMPTRK
jgi:hypothetical protein